MPSRLLYSSSLLVLLNLVASVFGEESFTCLTDAEARGFVADFKTIAAEHSGYQKVAKRILADDFTSISDSVNFADEIPV